MAPVNCKEKKETQHIQAFARLRPFNKAEIDCNAKQCLEINGKDILVNLNHGSKRFSFDKVFGMESKQKDVYMTIVQPIIKEVMQGYNCTVFAYGQTGTGKTYTMIGNPTPANISYKQDSHAGIIPRTLGHLFETLNKNVELDFTVRVSYLELYNEVLIDLLSTEDKVLKIYEDQKHKGSVQVHGLEEVTIFNKEQVYEILQAGNDKRTTASTMMNAQSSRSHTVFTITLHSREATPEGEELVKTGKLNLVDLAGSENISRSGANDKRAREAGNINQSLLTLGRVIKGLVEKNAHIPYRESKLTRILQDSLGGKTKTTIIATVSPASNNVEETLSTLDYAFRARNITNRPEVNQKMCKTALLQKYLEEIERLKKDVLAARSSDGFYMDIDNYNLLVGESEKTKEDLLKTVEECSQLGGRVQELERVREELEQVYSVTRQELTDSNLNLSKCKINLKKHRTQRQIHQELIDKYDEMQNTLFEDRKLLSKALNDYNTDITALRNKVDDLYQVINKNDTTSKLFVNHYSQQHKTMVSDVTKLSKIVCNNTKDLELLLVEASNQNNTILTSGKDKILNMEMECTKTINGIQSDIQKQLTDEYNYLVHEMKLSEETAKTILDMMESKNKCIAQKHDQLLKKIQEISTNNAEHVSALNKINAEMFSKVQSGIDRVILMQECLNKVIDKELESAKGMEQKLVNVAQNIEDTQERLKNELVSDYEDLLSRMNELIANKMIKTLDIFKVAKDVTHEMKTTQSSFTTGFKQIMDSHKKSCVETSILCVENKNYLQKAEIEVYERCDENKAILDNFFKEAHDSSNQIKNTVQDNKEFNDYLSSVRTGQSKRNSSYEEEHKSQENKFKNSLQGLLNELQHFAKDNNEIIEAADTNHKTATSNINNKLEDLEMMLKSNLNEHQSTMENVQELFTNFKENLFDTKPKGDTPLRKNEVVKYDTPERVSKNILRKFKEVFNDETLDGSLLEISLSDSEHDTTGPKLEQCELNSSNENVDKENS